VQNAQDLQAVVDEPKLTPQQVAKLYGLHPSKVRRIFVDEPGVIRIGHSATRQKKQYFSLRIPLSVVVRVFDRMTVGGRDLRTPTLLQRGRSLARLSREARE
jgi:hypothetical protein